MREVERISSLKITDMEIFSVKGRHWPKFPWVFLEVETDAGITGIGESLSYKSSGVIESLKKAKKFLIGKDPTRIEFIWENLYREGFNHPAISGIEIALWDILGKRLEAPIHELLGGKSRDSVEVYVDGFFRGAEYVEEEYAEKARDAVKKGFNALKMDVDDPVPSGNSLNRTLTPEDLEQTVKVVKAVRNRIGDSINLAIDCHGAFDFKTAVSLAEKLEDLGLMWIEDPVTQSNLRIMSEIAQRTDTLICTGELLDTRFEFRELFERHAADIIMPDVARTGGILELKKIAALADTYLTPIAPHNMVGPIATMASVQVCACVPNFYLLEFQMGDVSWKDSIIESSLPVKDGGIIVPDKPGLGIDLNKEELKKHLIP